MKRAFYVAIIIVFATLALVACGDSGRDDLPPPMVQYVPEDTPASAQQPSGDNAETPDTSGDTDVVDEPEAPAAFFFKIGEAVVELNENITYVIADAGQPIGELELPSCAFDGMDRVFRYPGADLYTYPVGNDDFVYNIAFFDDTVRTAEGGLRLGSNLQAVLDAYGDDFSYDSGMYTFTRGLTVLEFLVADETVIGITYRFLVEI